jgi:hypothetical protein
VRYPLRDTLELDLVPHCVLIALRSQVTLRHLYSNERRLPCITQETQERTEARALDAPSTRVAVHRSDQTYYVRQQKTSLQKNKLKSSATIRCIVTHLQDLPSALLLFHTSDVSIAFTPCCCSSGYGPCALCSTLGASVSLQAQALEGLSWGLTALPEPLGCTAGVQ